MSEETEESPKGTIALLARVFEIAEFDTQSPIERQLLIALVIEAIQRNAGSIEVRSPDEPEPWRIDGGLDYHDVRIDLQSPIGEYRVDLLVSLTSRYLGTTQVAAVECDGHEFHEKTKEQAARDKRRDRVIQAHAHVLRFTGSEIHRNAAGCAREVYALLDKRTRAAERERDRR